MTGAHARTRVETARGADNVAEAPVQQWTEVTTELEKGEFSSLDNHPSRYSTWLTTLNDDGSPHVTDPDVVARIAGIYATRGGWPAEPDESGHGITAPFNAPGLGPPPWFIYRIEPTSATSVLASGDTGGSTRWTF